MERLSLRTSRREELVDITSLVRGLVRDKGWTEGMLFLHCPHTTGALTINEGADPDVIRDLILGMDRLAPRDAGYRHAEGNSDAHIKSSLVGCGQAVIVSGGEIRLGTWQHIFFCEWDGPRSRTVWAQFLGT